MSKRTAVSAKRMRKMLIALAEDTALNAGVVSRKRAEAAHLKAGMEVGYRCEPTAGGGLVLMTNLVFYGADAVAKLAELEEDLESIKQQEKELLAQKQAKKQRKRAKKRARKLGEPE